MSFLPVFAEFLERTHQSLQEGTFAKLTLAKTIGDTEIKNIFIRPALVEGQFLISILARYKTEEVESFHSLEDAFRILTPFMNNPFLTALLFTTDADVVFKLNKKRVGSISEQPPTFKNPSAVLLEIREKGIVI